MTEPSEAGPGPKPFRLGIVSIVRDEADVIEAFVRHNLTFADGLVIEDDGSTDGTREILAALKDEGLPLEIHHGQQQASFFQADRMKALIQRAVVGSPWDFLFVLDADEFLSVADRATLERNLAAVPPGQAGGLRAWQYLPRPLDPADDPFTFVSDRTFPLSRGAFKVALPADVAESPGLELVDGHHSLFCFRRNVVVNPLPDTTLAHYSVRSHDQIVTKTIMNYCRWRSRHDFNPDTTAQGPVRAMAALRASPSLRLDSIDGQSACYVGDPASPAVVTRPFERLGGPRRHDGLARIRPYEKIATALDALTDRQRTLDVLGSTRGRPENAFLKFVSKSVIGRWRALSGGHTTLKAEWQGTVHRWRRSLQKRIGGPKPRRPH